MDWQPIETAPKTGEFLTWGRFGATADSEASETMLCIAGRGHAGSWLVQPCSPMRSGYWQPTHWLPLPEPPKKEARRQKQKAPPT